MKLEPDEDETLDELLRGRLKLLQPKKGARVSLDPLLLADFATRSGEKLGRVADLGCGGGVIGIALALADAAADVIGIELDDEMAALARRNVALNGVGDRVEIIAGDLARPTALPLLPATFDVAVANPPYQASGRGRRALGEARAMARQELAVTLDQVLETARRLLRPRGRLAIVFPAERAAELLALLVAASLQPRALRAVHSFAEEPARRVLVEAVSGSRGGLSILAPLVVHEADRSFTPELTRILEPAAARTE